MSSFWAALIFQWDTLSGSVPKYGLEHSQTVARSADCQSQYTRSEPTAALMFALFLRTSATVPPRPKWNPIRQMAVSLPIC